MARTRKKTASTRPRITHVEARGELKNEPDWDKFAWALLQYVKLCREKVERKDQQSRQETEQ